MKNIGLVQIYSGDGKGKTTAAVGLCVRASGAGLLVCFVQFMKGETSSELYLMQKLGINILCASNNKNFVFQMGFDEKNHYKAQHQSCFKKAIGLANSFDIMVFDEAMSAMETEMLEEEQMLAFLKAKPPHLEVILTGRNPPKCIADIADYHSEIIAVKHPFSQGVPARKGIEK